MARGFSLYAPVIGVILGSMALMVMAALMNEEAARIAYLRMLRASYAYALPVQTMRYDGILSFSVFFRTKLEETPITPEYEPDVADWLRTFIDAFSTAVGGDIVTSNVNWKTGDVDVDVDVQDDYVLVTVAPQGVGPVYTLTFNDNKGQESLSVPLFPSTTQIYIPFPLGRLSNLAKELQNDLSEDFPNGIAYGACREGGHGHKEKTRDDLESWLNDWLSDHADDWGVEDLTVKDTDTETRSEVVCVLGTTYEGYVVFLEGSEEYPGCHVVTTIEVSGRAHVGDTDVPFLLKLTPWEEKSGNGNRGEDHEDELDNAQSWEDICGEICTKSCSSKCTDPTSTACKSCQRTCAQSCSRPCDSLKRRAGDGHSNSECRGLQLTDDVKAWLWIRESEDGDCHPVNQQGP